MSNVDYSLVNHFRTHRQIEMLEEALKDYSHHYTKEDIESIELRLDELRHIKESREING